MTQDITPQELAAELRERLTQLAKPDKGIAYDARYGTRPHPRLEIHGENAIAALWLIQNANRILEALTKGGAA